MSDIESDWHLSIYDNFQHCGGAWLHQRRRRQGGAAAQGAAGHRGGRHSDEQRAAVRRQDGQRQALELQTKVREDLTITEKAPTSY